MKQEAIVHGLKWLEIDGAQSIEEIIDIVAQHFVPYLPSKQGEDK